MPPSDRDHHGRDEHARDERGRPGAHLGRSLLAVHAGVLSWVAFCLLCAVAARALITVCTHAADALRCERIVRLEWGALVAVEAAVLLLALLASSTNRNRRRRVRALVAGAVTAPLALLVFLLLPLPGT